MAASRYYFISGMCAIVFGRVLHLLVLRFSEGAVFGRVLHLLVLRFSDEEM